MTSHKKAWSLTELASVLSISETVIRDAVDKGDLVRRHPTSRGVFYEADVDSWMRSLPTEKPHS